jgi:hypothetical protein
MTPAFPADRGQRLQSHDLLGHLGSDGQTSYFFDPNSGCSVISGAGVSC